MVAFKPDNYPTMSPYICIDGAAEAVEFYKSVLGATERMRFENDGKIGHLELAIGESVLMLSDEYPEMGVVGPKSLGGTAVSLGVYVEDVDVTFAAAIAAGATELSPVADQFYGDRSGTFLDPWGHRWSVMTHLEEVDVDEMAQRAAEAMGD